MDNQMAQAAGISPVREQLWSGAGTRSRGISGSTLKIIAIVAMLIDHIGAVVLNRMLEARGMTEALLSGNFTLMSGWLSENSTLFLVNSVMRSIGRIGFPIFAFLLVEGFLRTRDVKKYALRLGIFALVSEAPFDLANSGKLLEFNYQNVFFTLFIGLLVMIAFNRIAALSRNSVCRLLLRAAALAAGMAAAQLLKTDYAAIGVVCIMALYIFRKNKTAQITAGCVAFLWEITAPLAFIPIGFYNGKRGLNLKYVFYAFYPVHLFLLYLISVAMGYGAI